MEKNNSSQETYRRLTRAREKFGALSNKEKTVVLQSIFARLHKTIIPLVEEIGFNGFEILMVFLKATIPQQKLHPKVQENLLQHLEELKFLIANATQEVGEDEETEILH